MTAALAHPFAVVLCRELDDYGDPCDIAYYVPRREARKEWRLDGEEWTGGRAYRRIGREALKRIDLPHDPDGMPVIWLQPWCDSCDGIAMISDCDPRQWSDGDQWGECGEPDCRRVSIPYVRAPHLDPR